MPRDASGARAFLPDDAEPSDDWHERVRELHEEGYTAVGGAVEARRSPELAPYAAGGGRHPRFPHPLVCPSLLDGLEPNARSPAFPPTGRSATSRRCSTAGSCSDFDRDLVVDAREDERAERERDEARHAEVERVGPMRQRAAEERCAYRLDRR